MLLLLQALSRRGRQWFHGYDIIKETGLRSGTLYPLLMRMAEQGLIEAEWRQPEKIGRPARHVYRLTTRGAAFALATLDGEGAASIKPALAC